MKEIDQRKFSIIDDLINKKQYDLALKKISKLYSNEPNNVALKHKLAQILIKTGKNNKARRYLESLKNVPNRGIDAKYDLAKLDFDDGYIEAARSGFKSLLGTRLSLSAICKLGELEESEGNIEEAIKYFKMLKNTSKRQYAIQNLLPLELHIEHYEECLIYLDELSKSNERDVVMIKLYQFYIKYKLGKFNNKKNIPSGYLHRQILNYDREKAIEHIKLHLNESDNKDNNSKFYSNISIEELYEKVKENLHLFKVKSYGLTDKYLLDLGYPVGTSNRIETSIIEIAVLCNSCHIISMYPAIANSKNINGLTKKEKTKVKNLQN